MYCSHTQRVARQIISGEGLAAFADWSKMTPEEWAEEVYRLPTGGRFSFGYAPYSREMFRSIWAPHRIETVFRMFSRGLKSTVILLSLGYIMDQSPRDILSLWPTNNHAELFSKDILTVELLDCVERLNWLGTRAKKRVRDNCLLHKRFHGGKIDMFGANAPGDMRRAKGSFLYADEIDAIQETETDEGDQLSIFEKRGDEFPDTISVKASYPSISGHSRIDQRMDRTDCSMWNVTCLLCGGEPFVMHRVQLRYDENHLHEAKLECPRCNGLLSDAQRYEMAHRQGFDNWVSTKEYKGRKGFHGNSMLWPHPVDLIKYPGGYLQKLAEREVADEKSRSPAKARQVTKNTEDAESYDPDTKSEIPPDGQKLFNRREKYATAKQIVIPAKGLLMTGFVDVQPDRVEVSKIAWGRDEEAWVIEHVVVSGDINARHVWEALELELMRTYAHEHGPQMGLSWTLIDAGHNAQSVLAFLGMLHKKASPIHGKVRASRGSSNCPAPPIEFKYKTLSKQLKGHWIGTNEAKDIIYSRLRLEEIGPGYIHFGENLGGSYFQQLTVEKVKVEYERGHEVRKYRNEKNARNETLDCFVGCLAGFLLRRWNFDALEAQLMAKPDDEEVEEEIERLPPSSFVGGQGFRI